METCFKKGERRENPDERLALRHHRPCRVPFPSLYRASVGDLEKVGTRGQRRRKRTASHGISSWRVGTPKGHARSFHSREETRHVKTCVQIRGKRSWAVRKGKVKEVEQSFIFQEASSSSRGILRKG